MEGSAEHVPVTVEESKVGRERWARKIEYLLSVLGFIVGFGNVWRFPYICFMNGGGAFLIPYLIVLVFCGLPVFFMESILGQFTAKPINKVWGICPLFSGIGTGMMILLINGCIYYNSILGWILYYVYSSVKSPLPWSHCGNSWNTDSCLSGLRTKIIANNSVMNKTMIANNTFGFNTSYYPHNETMLNQFKTRSAAEEFWRFNVIEASSGLGDFRSMIDHLSVTTLISFFVIFLCLIRGIKSVGKVVYVTVILPYLLLVILLIRSLTLPGSLDGIIYFLKPNFEKLLEIEVWIQAGVQVFYSIGTGWGGLITMASFNKFDNNCLKDTYILGLCGEGTSLFAGLGIFSVLGFMAHEADVPITEVVQSGPGLVFVAYPEGLSRLPLPNVWALLFFLALFTVGLDTMFTSVESLLDAVAEVIPIFKSRKTLYRAGAVVIMYILNLLFCTQAGIYLFQLTDWYVTSVANFTFMLLESLIVGWIYGTERITKDIEMMIGRGPPFFIRICWCFITPVIIVSLLLSMFVKYKPPRYGDYEYPAYARGLGWIIAFSPLVPIIVVAGRTLYQSPGKTLKQKLSWSIRPSEDWKPASKSPSDSYYNDYNPEQKVSLLQRVKLNVFGNKHVI